MLDKPKFAIDFNYHLDYQKLERSVLEAEESGYHSVWFIDHLIWKGDRHPYSKAGSILECCTVLSALAAVTKRIRIGSLVLCNSYRNPALVAKIGATLDVISEGRLEFGIGAGWHEEECLAYGYPFPTALTRIMQLKEGVSIIKKMWTMDKASFCGEYYQIRDAICEPKPIQKPHPPIWIGGGGEKLTLRVVAEFADGHNINSVSPEVYRKKVQVLKEHCMRVGRDFDSIKKSWKGTVIIDKDPKRLKNKFEARKPKKGSIEGWKSRMLIGTPEECVERLQEYVDLGVELFILSFQGYIEDRKLFENTVIPEFK